MANIRVHLEVNCFFFGLRGMMAMTAYFRLSESMYFRRSPCHRVDCNNIIPIFGATQHAYLHTRGIHVHGIYLRTKLSVS